MEIKIISASFVIVGTSIIIFVLSKFKNLSKDKIVDISIPKYELNIKADAACIFLFIGLIFVYLGYRLFDKSFEQKINKLNKQNHDITLKYKEVSSLFEQLKTFDIKYKLIFPKESEINPLNPNLKIIGEIKKDLESDWATINNKPEKGVGGVSYTFKNLKKEYHVRIRAELNSQKWESYIMRLPEAHMELKSTVQ